MGRRPGRRTAARAAALVVTAAVTLTPAGAVGSDAQRGAADPAPFVWTGGSELASGDARVSSPGNWAGGVAPAAGQRVQLVFPALECVAQGDCEEVLNDVPGLVVESLRFTSPRRTPVMYWVPDSYVVTGLELRLVGPLVSTGEQNSEKFTPGLGLYLPLDLGGRERRWRVADTPVYVGRVVGEALTVRARRGGGLNVQSSIATNRYVEQGNGSAEVFDGALNAKTRGTVTYRRTDVQLVAARLGSLTTEDVRLELLSADRPNVARGPVTFDADTRITMQAATAEHPLLKASGPLDLGGARLDGDADCTDAELGKPFTVLRGSRLRGQLRDEQGRPLADGAVVSGVDVDWCEDDDTDYVARIGYTRRSVTLTLLARP